jgi:hypothetical protein
MVSEINAEIEYHERTNTSMTEIQKTPENSVKMQR